MTDPFAELSKTLHPIFHLESMRNHNYVYPEIQPLKEALAHFNLNNKETFINLLKAIRAALPYIEKWRIDFNIIKNSLDALAPKFNLPVINWNAYLSKSNTSSKFQFSALNHSRYTQTELLTWLAAKSGATFSRGNITLQIHVLLQYREHIGFSQKLNAHLKKDPDFLFRLIMESEKNFSQIAHTRLVLYLTDTQLAEAIIRHLPSLIQKQENPTLQASQLANKLNEILSNGRSVSTLLRNAEAKSILDKSDLLQQYQKDNQGVTPKPPSSRKDGGVTSGF